MKKQMRALKTFFEKFFLTMCALGFPQANAGEMQFIHIFHLFLEKEGVSHAVERTALENSKGFPSILVAGRVKNGDNDAHERYERDGPLRVRVQPCAAIIGNKGREEGSL